MDRAARHTARTAALSALIALPCIFAPSVFPPPSPCPMHGEQSVCGSGRRDLPPMRKGPRMASDYGDDAGEKMIEDFARFGERMGERAMYDRARRMRSAFENATAATRGAAGEGDAREKPAEWAK